MFNKIWKDQIQKPKGGATIFQPKEKMKPDKQDEPCNRRLKEYADELNAKTHIYQVGIRDFMKGEYNPVPEDVACKALKTLERMGSTDGQKSFWHEEHYISMFYRGIGNTFKMHLLIVKRGGGRHDNFISLQRKMIKDGRDVTQQEIEKYMKMVDWR